LRPFLVDRGYTDFDRGVALATVGLAATLVGTFLGGVLTTVLGLGHALWVFGVLQIFSNVGYVLLARAGVDRLLMYGATGFESLTSGLGTGAFSVLLLRLTEKRFSATQYALFSSLFGLPRVLAGPVSGFTVEALGWEAFFWATMLAGIPGMVLLHRFVPLGVRDPVVAMKAPFARPPLGTAALVARGLIGGMAALLLAGLAVASLGALRALRLRPQDGFELLAQLSLLWRPDDAGGWLALSGVLAFGLIGGLGTAAVFAARVAPETGPDALPERPGGLS
jgi:PAT family beta-lactamase induction signal transducer AmpG